MNKYYIDVDYAIRDTIFLKNIIEHDGSGFYFANGSSETLEIENYLKEYGYYDNREYNYVFYPIKNTYAVLELKFNFYPYLNNNLEHSKELRNHKRMLENLIVGNAWFTQPRESISFKFYNDKILNNDGERLETTFKLNRNDIYDNSWAVIIGIDKSYIFKNTHFHSTGQKSSFYTYK